MAVQRSKEQISDIMRRVKSKDTAPEVMFRKALWARGIRYRLHGSGLPGKPDIVIPGARLVIYVDGDYWHGNQWKTRGYASLKDQFVASPNAEYWVGKISGNMRRDREHIVHVLADGWRALRFWESDIVTSLDRCVDITTRAIYGHTETSIASRIAEQTVAEFFAGIGLVRWALQKKGWRIVFANDLDPQKYEMYRANFSDAPEHFSMEDVHRLSADDVPTVSLATASFPCNDLSLAGGMKGLAGEHSGAFWGFMRVLQDMGDRRPPLVLLENVAGWLTSHGGKNFAESLLAMNELGYSCDAFILNAADFVPQSRVRLFVVGVLDECKDICLSDTLRLYESQVRPKALAEFILMHPEIRWHLRNLPSTPQKPVSIHSILEDIPHSDPRWWSRERSAYLLNQMSERHAATARSMIDAPEYTYGTAFRRVRQGKSMAELRVDGIAGCLRTPRGGSGRQILIKAGKGEYHVRLLTPRECARLQGVDDTYNINTPDNQALFGFGDAVCVPAIEWIAENYLNPIVTDAIHGSVLRPVIREA